MQYTTPKRCKDKQAFTDKPEATRYMRWLQERDRAGCLPPRFYGRGFVFRPYKCSECGQWHVGSQAKP